MSTMNTKNFLKFLLEDMSLSDAHKLFGLSGHVDASDVAKIYRKLSMKYHPDRRGGSNEMMSKVNQAREILQKEYGKATNTQQRTSSNNQNDIWNPDNWEAISKRREAEFTAIIDYVTSLLKRFDPEVYRKKIEDVFQKPIYITKNTIEDLGFDRDVALTLELADKDKDIIFSLEFRPRYNIYDLRRKIFTAGTPVLNLAGQIIEIAMHSFVYVDGKKQVLQKQYYAKSSDSSIFNDATLLLPTERLKKLANGTVRKGKVAVRDFKAMFTKQFNAYMREINGQCFWAVPFPEKGIWVKVFRQKISFRFSRSLKPLVNYFIDDVCPLNVVDGKIRYVDKSLDANITRELNNIFHEGKYNLFEETEETLKTFQNALKQLGKDGNLKKFVDAFKR